MTWVVVAASAAIVLFAAAGVLRPFSTGRWRHLEAPADPLDEERRSLLRTLHELDEEHAIGQLTGPTYRSLRAETEARAVSVLRALEARDGAGELSSGLRSLRAPVEGNGARRPRAIAADGRRVMLAVAAGMVLLAGTVVVLGRAVSDRTVDQPISGGTTQENPLAFFEQRVARHPNDVAARLDLAQRYSMVGDEQSAVAQYLAVLGIDPDNAEAHANLGFVLFRAGRPEDGLRAVERALHSDPGYPEALYFKGVILLRGLDRPAEARASFQAYLDAAPFGSHREEVEALLEQSG